MKVLKHEWSEQDLLIAYYITKWDYNGLGIEPEDIIDSVIPNSTVNSLSMQVANFRYLLNLDGFKLSDSSKLMGEIVDKYDGVSQEEVKKLVLSIIDRDDVELKRVSRKNVVVEKRKSDLNKELEKNFESKLKMYKNLGRRLRKVS